MEQVARVPGLIAFWDFQKTAGGVWTSYFDSQVVDKAFPVYLRKIGDTRDYGLEDWPYRDTNAVLKIDSTGPFGHAVRFNRGYIYGAVPRAIFDKTPLDIRGNHPFSLIAWVKFNGTRHLVAGIWDEGGWGKYSGRRQVALFSGLFGSDGVIGHVSATGAASYPQSSVNGSQYARDRAIDGASFNNNTWVMMAMTFDSASHQLTAYLNGVATTKKITDPVAQDVFKYSAPLACNPFRYDWPIFSARAFIIKYNGYTAPLTGVYEHWLQIDVDNLSVTYGKTSVSSALDTAKYRIQLDIVRQGQSELTSRMQFDAVAGKRISLLAAKPIESGDTIVTNLQTFKDGVWNNVGDEVQRPVTEGAPFTFGRALGLGTDDILSGSDLFVDGVAVFSRVLSAVELRTLSFEGIVLTKKPLVVIPVRSHDAQTIDILGRRSSLKSLEVRGSRRIPDRP